MVRLPEALRDVWPGLDGNKPGAGAAAERLFDLWKRHGRLDKSRSKKPWRILCELYAKLLGLVVQHWVLVSGSFWAGP